MNNARKLIESRKLLVTLVLIVIGALIDYFKPDGLSSNLRDLLVYLGGVYVLANVGTNIASEMNNKKAKPDDTKINALNAQIIELEASNKQLVQNVELINTTLAGVLGGKR